MTDDAPKRLRRAEAILRERTSRLVLILERPWNDENVHAVLRTAESFGVQHVWTIRHPHMRARAKKRVTKGSHHWLTRRVFDSIEECVAAARQEGVVLWATDLGQGADEWACAEDVGEMPARVGLVIGAELSGVSPAVLAAADRRIVVPTWGFTESLNLSVAAALLLQRMFDADDSLRGAMGNEERAALREKWFVRLAGKNEERRREFAQWALKGVEPFGSTRPEDGARKPRLKKTRARRPSIVDE